MGNLDMLPHEKRWFVMISVIAVVLFSLGLIWVLRPFSGNDMHLFQFDSMRHTKGGKRLYSRSGSENVMTEQCDSYIEDMLPQIETFISDDGVPTVLCSQKTSVPE